jgi:hypothetical protein
MAFDKLQGKFMDFNYRATAKKIGFKIDKVAGDDLRQFPIERARSRFAIVYVLLHTACVVGYGWALHQRTVRLPYQHHKFPKLASNAPLARFRSFDTSVQHRLLGYLYCPGMTGSHLICRLFAKMH